jgi:hypothetical protein
MSITNPVLQSHMSITKPNSADPHVDNKSSSADPHVRNKSSSADPHVNNKPSSADPQVRNKPSSADPHVNDKSSSADPHVNDKSSSADSDEKQHSWTGSKGITHDLTFLARAAPMRHIRKTFRTGTAATRIKLRRETPIQAILRYDHFGRVLYKPYLPCPLKTACSVAALISALP